MQQSAENYETHVTQPRKFKKKSPKSKAEMPPQREPKVKPKKEFLSLLQGKILNFHLVKMTNESLKVN